MLKIALDDDPMIEGSPGRRDFRALCTRAIADEAAGRPCASEHSIYVSTYRNAATISAVERGELIISLGQATDCDTGEDGMVVVYGEGSTDEYAEFRASAYLRNLTAHGVRIKTLAGEDVTHQIQLLH